jgi:hypothetical protein
MDKFFQLRHFIFICLGLVLLAHAQTFAQSSREQAWLEAIPAPQRESFLKDLNYMLSMNEKVNIRSSTICSPR